MASVKRTYDARKVAEATQQYSDSIEGFFPEEWLNNELNIALINENNDIALFEHQCNLTNTVCGHYFFFSRGNKAFKAAVEFLNEVFNNTYIETITGLTPVEHKGALWMNRKLGFVEHGEVTTSVGPCKFVMMTKQQWKGLNDHE